MTSMELSEVIGTLTAARKAVEALQRLQERLDQAYPDDESQLLSDVLYIDSSKFYWALTDVLRSASQEAEIRSSAFR